MLQYYFVLSLLVLNCVGSNSTSDCGKKGKIDSFLDIAVAIINKAKSDLSSYERHMTKIPVDCADILRMGQKASGVYTIWPMNRVTEDKLLNVYCDMDTDGGGWTVIQRRGNYGNPKDYFFREWQSYKKGFGNIEKEFWIGNDNIFALTNQKLYSARFDLQDAELDRAYALYDIFWIDDEPHNYTLHVEAFSGDAGDSLTYHNNKKFSTKDVDNDNAIGNCAEAHKGAWWYDYCRHSNLNGLYIRGEDDNTSVNWHAWKKDKSLESAEIKIRPKSFVVSHDFTSTPQ